MRRRISFAAAPEVPGLVRGGWGESFLCLSLILLLALTAHGVSWANVRVNQDPPGLMQNSPSVTLNPFLPGNLVSAYVDDPFAPNGIGTSYSFDGGGTWLDSQTQIPSVWGVELAPSTGADGMGNVYVGFASFDAYPPANVNSGVYVSLSTDGGVNFGPPIQVSLQSGPPGTVPWVAMPKFEVDDFPASPYYPNDYMAWELDLTNWMNSDCQFSWSPPGAGAWSAPITINDIPGAQLVLWPDLCVGPTGTVGAAWLDTPYWMQHQGQIWFDRSTDGGLTFGQDVGAVTFWCVPAPLTDGGGAPKFPAMSYPCIETNPSNANHSIIVYAADPDNGPAAETRIDVGDQPPGTADAWLRVPQQGGANLSCNRAAPNHVHAIWIDERNYPPGTGVGELYYHGAPNVFGIANWRGADVHLCTQPGMLHGPAYNASLVSSGPHVYVTWNTNFMIDVDHVIFFNTSHDDGVTWLNQAVGIDTITASAGFDPVLSADGLNVCAAWPVWIDSTHTDIYAQRSTDGGATWLTTEVAVRTGQGVVGSNLDIAQTGNTVYLVWAETVGGMPGSDIYASRSTDGGFTWSAPTRLNFNDPPGASYSWEPKVCCSPTGGVYVSWTDQRVNGVNNPYFAYSNNFGLIWLGDTRLNTNMPPGMSFDQYTHIACDRNYVAVTYQSDRNNLGVSSDIFGCCSLDGGLTWAASDVRLDVSDPPGLNDSSYPRVSVYDYGYPNQVYFYWVWQDDRNSQVSHNGYDIYGIHASYFPASGLWQWLGADYRIDVGDQPGVNNSEMPQVASDHTGPYYLWRDLRNGLGDTYANQIRTGPDEGDIQLVETFDGGATWTAPIRINDDATTNDQSHPWADIKPDGTVDITWMDSRNFPNDDNMDIYFTARPPGQAFIPNVQVNNQPVILAPGQWMGDYLTLEVDTLMAYIQWPDTRRAGDLLLGDIFHNMVENPQLTSVDDEDLSLNLPDRPQILLSQPNPFTSEVTVRFALPETEEVRAEIYDVTGRLVKSLHRGSEVAGHHELTWDGTDRAGRVMPAGVYFFRLETPRFQESSKMVMLR